MKYVVLSLMVIFSASCGGNKNPNFLELEEEDIAAKELLQGIWLDDETESPLMRVEGDTIYYADSRLHLRLCGRRFTRMEMIRLTTR